MNIHLLHNIVLYITLGIYLLVCSIKDLRTHTISRQTSVIYALLLLVMGIANGSLSPSSLVLRLIPGLFLLLIGFATKEAIGYGDGIVILVVGIALGLESTMIICTSAFILAAIISIYLLIRKNNKKLSIPFVPFLFVAFILYTFLYTLEVL